MSWNGEPGVQGAVIDGKIRGEKKNRMRLEFEKVIKTENVEGRGTEEDPVRTVVRYWDENGKLLFETKKTN